MTPPIDMDRRLAELPVMAQRADKIPAPLYNLWRRARRRFGAPMRLKLPGLKEIEMVLADGYWVCVDTVKFDVPVIAWVDFEDADRDALHLPIACKLNYYHFAASAVRARALELMAELLKGRLEEA
ncbi:MAG TPA: hypothetical protein PLG99_00425 [Kaistiaceae bacterium]|nr:hypothetical protein [Kaistiaceae bacterium]